MDNVTRSYLALSVTWAGTETERAPQQLARDRSWHPSLLGALVLRACYVTARSWEPWCSEMFTLPLALGSLGVENCLRNRSLFFCFARDARRSGSGGQKVGPRPRTGAR